MAFHMVIPSAQAGALAVAFRRLVDSCINKHGALTALQDHTGDAYRRSGPYTAHFCLYPLVVMLLM